MWGILCDKVIERSFREEKEINAFGYSSNTANDNIELLGPLLLIGDILFLSSSVLIIITGIKENRNLAILCSFLMIGGLVIFCYGLATIEDFENILEGLNFLKGGEHTIFYGAVVLGLSGDWEWRLGNGFFYCNWRSFHCIYRFFYK
ncbi:MAG: hypothetical protein ACFFB0_13705 [Promethearchaeota archaeon]